MCKVINFNKYRQARRGTLYPPRRAPPQPRGLVQIGVVSAELMRRLTESD